MPVLLPDVNVLVYAHREDTARHPEYRDWLRDLVTGPSSFGMADLVLSGFLRTVTHRRVFAVPTPVDVALRFAVSLRSRDNCVPVAPGPRHWAIFVSLCERVQAKGSLVPDAYLAALAIESGSEWITTDRDFTRFPHLRSRHPFD